MRVIQSHRAAWTVLLAAATGLGSVGTSEAAPSVVIWDTGVPFADEIGADGRAHWEAVPSELFVFEADPAKAASDPGYYGRPYTFRGDAVVETRNLVAVFWSARGRAVLYSKTGLRGAGGGSDSTAGFGARILEFAPLLGESLPGRISHCGIVRNAADQAVLEVIFASAGGPQVPVVCSFDRSEIVQVNPAPCVEGIRLLSPVAYGVLPGFVDDDLIFSAAAEQAGKSLTLPVENVFVGLLEGENNQVVMTWPTGSQQLTWRPGEEEPGKVGLGSIDFRNDGRSVYLAMLGAPGIWHREELTSAYLEKEVVSDWTPPFPATWKTQLREGGVRTTYTFRESKGTIWRGVPGSYEYPVWLDGDRAWYHLSKKVPPKGESVVYFLEGRHTPIEVTTPVDVIKNTLGRQASDRILDVAGRALRTHHRRGDDNVHRACTCGCTEAIQAVFEAGQEVTERETVAQALEDMNFFVRCHVDRIEEYMRFAQDMIRYLQAQSSSTPELQPLCDALAKTAQRIPQEYTVQKENMKSLDYARDLTRQTLALTDQTSSDNLSAYMKLLDAWRAMGGAQDYTLALCHTITRELAQQAGYGCAHNPQAVTLAKAVRARCRQVLRNPDGYEIWADY